MRNQRGSIMVITLCFILVFTLMGFGSVYFAMMHNEAAEKRAASNKAFWVAEAGLQKTIWEYSQHSCQGLFREGITATSCGASPIPCVTATACTSCSSCGVPPDYSGNKRLEPASPSLASAEGNAYGDYNIAMNYFNSSVTVTGFYPKRASTSNPSQRKVTLSSTSPYQYAFFAKNSIVMDNNSCTDGFNYLTPLSNGSVCGGGNSDGNAGGIGTNGTTANVVTLNNGVYVHGDVSTGPGGTVSNSGTIAGTVTHTNSISLPSATIPSEFGPLTNLGNITNNISLGLSSGICSNSGTNIGGICYYKYTSINLSTNKTVTFVSPVRIDLTSTTTAFQSNPNFAFNLNSGASVVFYTGGKVSLTNNGSVNSNQATPNPADFEIRSTRNAADGGIEIANNGNFYGVVYAPDTDVTVGKNAGGSTTFYGAMIGLTIHSNNNTPMHFEKGLAKGGNFAAMQWSEPTQ